MIERGSGRTSSLTDWHRMDVNSMWACLQDHDTANHWKQVAGWRKICDLAQAHLSRLQEYRRGLAAAWPPASNTAALAYLSQLDELIDKVRRTHDAAATNYTALAAATQAIGGTRTRLQKIHEEYAAKLQQKRAYEATAADPKAAMGSRVTDRPVTDADLEQLNVQARGIMYGLSTELQQAQAALRQPPPAPRPSGKDTADPDVYGAGAVPVIPAIVPAPVGTNSATRVSPRPSATALQQDDASTPGRVGPILGGANINTSPPTPTLPSGGALPPPLAITPDASAPRSPTAPIAFSPQAPIGGERVSHPPTKPAIESSSKIQNSTKAPPFHSLPSSGLIGGMPGPGMGQPVGGGAAPRRVNPIGGVIGGGAGTSPTGAAGTRPGGTRGFPGAHGVHPAHIPRTLDAHSPSRFDQPGQMTGESRNWDPDHPWDVDKGVPPVMRAPDEEGPIDPGPAIGLTR
ncbi:hypothetical protein [Micromonospora musae]|uniref:PPE domain-containing protein n=1 Tax=Micromonospora musae TaxID=1894970 RepID=A0A3A9XTB3_9ACTN|nr:hypothetical protein [Micromonospora musae]RKN28349.1 hypothetical protein D7044_26205 [Micromonospora musae]